MQGKADMLQLLCYVILLQNGHGDQTHIYGTLDERVGDSQAGARNAKPPARAAHTGVALMLHDCRNTQILLGRQAG